MCDIIVQFELLKYINIYLNYASLLIKVQVVSSESVLTYVCFSKHAPFDGSMC